MKVAGQVRHAVDHVDEEVVCTQVGSLSTSGSDLTGDASILSLAGAEGSRLHVLRGPSGPRSHDLARVESIRDTAVLSGGAGGVGARFSGSGEPSSSRWYEGRLVVLVTAARRR